MKVLCGEVRSHQLDDSEQLLTSMIEDLALIAAAEHDALISYAGASRDYEWQGEAPPSLAQPLGTFYANLRANVDAVASDAARGCGDLDADDTVAAIVATILDDGDRDAGVALLSASLESQSETTGLLVAYRAAQRARDLVKPALDVLATELAGVALSDLRCKRGDDAAARRDKFDRLGRAVALIGVHRPGLTRVLDDLALLAKLAVVVQSHARTSRDLRKSERRRSATRACVALMHRARFYYSAEAVRLPQVPIV